MNWSTVSTSRKPDSVLSDTIAEQPIANLESDAASFEDARDRASPNRSRSCEPDHPPANFVHRTMLLAAALMLLSAASGRADDQVLSKTPLEGRWKVVSAQLNGSEYMEDKIDKFSVTVEKNEMHFKIEGSDAEQAARFVVRPDKRPAEIDFTRQTRDHAWNNDILVTKLFRGWTLMEGKAIPAEDKGEGIYKLQGDKLTLCWRTIKGHENGEDGKVSQESRLRPTVFQSHLYDHQFLFVLERVK